MALSDLQKLFVVNTATSMWQQDLLLNAYFQGSSVGANLRAMLLGQDPVAPLTSPFDQAITGRLRADSASIRQNARNVQEAATMVGVATSAVESIADTLQQMQDLAQQVKDGDLTYSSSVATEYNALRDKITALVSSTQYNGITLLDSSKWGTSQISSSGNVYIQGMPSGGFNVTFRALNGVAWSSLKGTDLSSSSTLQTQLDTLSTYLGDMNTIADLYSSRADGLSSQATALESQADLLDQVVVSQTQSPTSSLEAILLRLLVRNTGALLDEQG